MSNYTIIHGRKYESLPLKKALNRAGFSANILPTSKIYRHHLPDINKILEINRKSFIIIYDPFIPPTIISILNKMNLVHKSHIIRLSGDPLLELQSRNFYKRIMESKMVLYGLANSLAVFYVSNYLKKIYEPKCQNIVHKTLYNGIDVNMFSPKKNNDYLFNNYIKNDETIKCICIMNFNILLKLGFYSSLAQIIKNIENLYNVKFYFIGNGSYYDMIKNYFKECKNVYFLGKIQRKVISEILPFFDIFIYPSSLDALPNAVLEACASGLPCISTNIGGIPEIILHKKTGFLANNSVEFQYYLELLIEDKTLRNYFGKASRKRIVKYFNWDIIGDNFVKAIISLNDLKT